MVKLPAPSIQPPPLLPEETCLWPPASSKCYTPQGPTQGWAWHVLGPAHEALLTSYCSGPVFCPGCTPELLASGPWRSPEHDLWQWAGPQYFAAPAGLSHVLPGLGTRIPACGVEWWPMQGSALIPPASICTEVPGFNPSMCFCTSSQEELRGLLFCFSWRGNRIYLGILSLRPHLQSAYAPSYVSKWTHGPVPTTPSEDSMKSCPASTLAFLNY